MLMSLSPAQLLMANITIILPNNNFLGRYRGIWSNTTSTILCFRTLLFVLFLFKTQRFGNYIPSPSSGKTYLLIMGQ
jgi:hypothetical protein